jgi:hypothetical protein
MADLYECCVGLIEYLPHLEEVKVFFSSRHQRLSVKDIDEKMNYDKMYIRFYLPVLVKQSQQLKSSSRYLVTAPTTRDIYPNIKNDFTQLSSTLKKLCSAAWQFESQEIHQPQPFTHVFQKLQYKFLLS